MLVNPNDPLAERFIAEVQEAAQAKGLLLHILEAGIESEIDTAFAPLIRRDATVPPSILARVDEVIE